MIYVSEMLLNKLRSNNSIGLSSKGSKSSVFSYRHYKECKSSVFGGSESVFVEENEEAVPPSSFVFELKAYASSAHP